MSGVNPTPAPISPALPLPPGYAPPPGSGNHRWKNITSTAGNLFSGLKSKWTDNSDAEKRYLLAAAAIIIIVMLIFVLLGFVFGFMSAFTLLPVLMPLAFAATLPMFMYARSKHRQRSTLTKEKFEELQKQDEQKAAAARKANRIFNRKLRSKTSAAASN